MYAEKVNTILEELNSLRASMIEVHPKNYSDFHSKEEWELIDSLDIALPLLEEASMKLLEAKQALYKLNK